MLFDTISIKKMNKKPNTEKSYAIIDADLSERDADRKHKKDWSLYIMIYLSIFTLLLFVTLLCNNCCFHLSNTTLNILITAGFIKVVSLSCIVVNHFYPLPKKAKVKSDV
jgi:hypothetical protein